MAKKDKDKPTEADYRHEADRTEALGPPDEPIFTPEPKASVKVLVPEPPKAPMASHVDDAQAMAESIVRRLAALSPPHLGGSAGVQLLNDARAWVALQEPQ